MTDYAALLRELAVPRLVGTLNHSRIREVLTRELEARGFTVERHEFVATPTRLGAVALAGAVIAWGAIGAVLMIFVPRHPWAVVGWVLTVLVVATHLLVTARARSGAGAEPAVRGVNLIARRPGSRPTIWLAAHYDSKGQPISMATRLVAVGLTLFGVAGLLAHAAAALYLIDPLPSNAVLLVVPALLGGILLAHNRATDGSPGAVDNASALVAVFAIADRVPRLARVGILFPDAEELGLVGARALVEERRGLLAGTAVVNLDGLDDAGRPIALVHRAGPLGTALARDLGGRQARWLPVLVDGVELAGPARECVTIMKGDWGTAKLVHTPGDTPDRLTLAGAQQVAEGVARVLALS